MPKVLSLLSSIKVVQWMRTPGNVSSIHLMERELASLVSTLQKVNKISFRKCLSGKFSTITRFWLFLL